MRFTKFTLMLALLFVLRMAAPYAAAQTKSNVATVTATYTVPESLSITVSGGPLVIPAGNTGASNPGTITGTYNLYPTHTQGVLFAIYPAGGLSAAMSNGSTNIPSADITFWASGASWGTCNQADTYALSGAADQCVGTSGYGTLLTQTALAAANFSGSLPSESFSVQFVGSTQPTQAGNYSGVFDVVAFAP